MSYGRTGRRDGRRFFNAPSVIPTQLGSPLVWLRSDLGITLNGSAVSAWADQSGNGRNTAQANPTLQMTYVASGGIGNRPYLRAGAAGTETRLSWASGAFAGITTGELYCIFNNDTDPPAGDWGGVFLFANNPAYGDIVPLQLNGHIYSGFLNNNRPTFGPGPGTTASPCCYEVFSSSGTTSVKINGAAVGSPTAATSLAPGGVCYIGSNTVRFLVGRIYEFIMYSSQLNAGKRQQLYTYFKRLYPGIPL